MSGLKELKSSFPDHVLTSIAKEADCLESLHLESIHPLVPQGVHWLPEGHVNIMRFIQQMFEANPKSQTRLKKLTMEFKKPSENAPGDFRNFMGVIENHGATTLRHLEQIEFIKHLGPHDLFEEDDGVLSLSLVTTLVHQAGAVSLKCIKVKLCGRGFIPQPSKYTGVWFGRYKEERRNEHRAAIRRLKQVGIELRILYVVGDLIMRPEDDVKIVSTVADSRR